MIDPSKVVTDTQEAAQLLYEALRRKNVGRPADLKYVFQTIVDEINEHIAVCEKADFELIENGNTSYANELLNEVHAWVGQLRNNYAFTQNQIDNCRRGIAKKKKSKDSKKQIRHSVESAATMLQQLAGDFEGWRMEYTGGWNLVVLTKPVVLHCSRNDVDVPFGRFKIRLSLTQMVRGVSRPYRIDPEAHKLVVSGYENVPHPHLRGSQLCEGDGELMITNALQSGNLFSFFIVIDQILNTYNSGSPYCKLDAYSRLYLDTSPVATNSSLPRCSGCRGRMDASRLHSCEHCGSSFCGGCSTYCENNEVYICSSCRSSAEWGCDGCESYGRRGCAVRDELMCAECEEYYDASDMIMCHDRQVSICRHCAVETARDNRICCDHPSDACQLRAYLSREYHSLPILQHGGALNADGTATLGRIVRRTCMDCSAERREAESRVCNNTFRCADCMRSRVADNDPCCATPVQACLYGQMVRAERGADAWAELPDGPVPELIGAADSVSEAVQREAGTGFGPPANG